MSKLFVKTYGCTLNKKDSLDVIKNNDFSEDLKDIKKAKFILINTCGVKEQTQTKIINFLKQLKKLKINSKKIIVFGCLVDIDKEALLKIMPDVKYFKVSEKNKINEIIGNESFKSKKTEISKTIVLSNGCLGNCNYCAVKFARGKLKSRPIKEIVNEIKKELEDEKVKEIMLTSQDNACYGKDIGENLVKLLKEITKIKKEFKIKIGMGNPQHILPILKDLIQIYKHKKIYKFLHIPIQSGDDDVLKEMNRNYKIKDVLKIINAFKKEIPNISIATDVIVGYPTEKEKNYENTLKIIKIIKPDFLNISRFGMRKNIQANKHKDLSGTIKKERSRKLTMIYEKIAFENNKKYLGKTKEITITEKGKNKTMVGKTEEYKSVVLQEKVTLNQKIKIKVIKTDVYHLTGKVLKTK